MADTVISKVIFTNTFLVAKDDDQAPALQTIGAGSERRQKRRHYKSRRGCIECKRRRVKCDEQIPCSSCRRRNTICLHAQPDYQRIPPPLSLLRASLETEGNPDISLLHLEAFHHWDTQTRPTLAFQQVWPSVVQHAFQHEFAMSAILCIAAMHLTALRPHVPKYAQMAMRMMTKSLGLFRRSLSEPFTKSNCDALLGTAILVTYMSWCDLGFLSEQHAESLTSRSRSRLDLSQDYLLLLSPGVVEVWMQAMPILINNRSVFVSMIHQHPRLNIEAAVAKRGHDPARFTEQFMTIWDDPRYQTTGLPGAMEKDKQLVRTPMPRAWHLLVGLEAQFSPDHFDPSVMSHPENDQCQLLVEALQQTVAAVDSTRAGMAGCPLAAASAITDSISTDAGAPVPSNAHQVEKRAFRDIVRKLSPLLSCITPPSVLLNPPASLEADVERLIYALPILCCGPNAKLAMKGDSRALVVLFHLYHVASVLLNKERGWWAGARGEKLKDAIREELKSRGLGVCLRK